jgi:hypothetical protein
VSPDTLLRLATTAGLLVVTILATVGLWILKQTWAQMAASKLEQAKEIDQLREAKHAHANTLTAHGFMIEQLAEEDRRIMDIIKATRRDAEDMQRRVRALELGRRDG